MSQALTIIRPWKRRFVDYTVVIPVFNGAATIHRAIDSALNQTLPPKRIKVFNNASTDSTGEIVRTLMNEHKIIELRESASKLSPLESFRASLENISGKFLWLAADDFLLPQSANDLWETRCDDTCAHPIGHRVVFFDKNLGLRLGKNFSETLSSSRRAEKFLEFPSDNSLFYSLVQAEVAVKCLPKRNSYAWDWVYTTNLTHHSKVHYQEVTIGLIRETSNKGSFQSQALDEIRFIDRLFPLRKASTDILGIHGLISWTLLQNLFLLNLYIAFSFGVVSRTTISSRFKAISRYSYRLLSNVWGKFRKYASSLHTVYILFEPLLSKSAKASIKMRLKRIRRNFGVWGSRFGVDTDHEILNLRGMVVKGQSHHQLPPFTKTSKIIEIDPLAFNHFSDLISLVQFFSQKSVLEVIVKNNFRADNHARIFAAFVQYGLIGNVRLVDSESEIAKKTSSHGNLEGLFEIAFSEWAARFNDLAVTAVKQTNGKPHISRRILVCLAEVPVPNRDSGSNDIIYYLAILKHLGHSVTVSVPHTIADKNSLRLLKSIATVITYSEINSNYPSIVIYGPYAYLYFEKLEIFQDYIYIMIDAVFRRYEQEKSFMNDDDLAILDFERKAILGAKVNLAISGSDLNRCEIKFPNSRFELFPIVRKFHDPEIYRGRKANRVLFIGSIRHTPNRLAAEFILSQIAPQLAILNSEITFTFVGQGTEDLIPKSRNVELLGLVDNVDSQYQLSFVSLAPMNVAAGINGKVLESIDYGLYSLVSKPVSFNLTPAMRKCTIQCNTVNDYVMNISQLFLSQKVLSIEDRSEVEGQIDGRLNAEVFRKFLA
jgi:glycosyltransferase involved in cell wall biosynthesis